jgi:hypothetical protein
VHFRSATCAFGWWEEQTASRVVCARPLLFDLCLRGKLLTKELVQALQVTALAADLNAMDPHAYTALPIAAARALSTERNAGVHDPLARKLVAGENTLLQAGANVGYMTKRALIGDELVLDGHVRGTRQVASSCKSLDQCACLWSADQTVR